MTESLQLEVKIWMWNIFDRPKDFPDGIIARRIAIAPNKVIPTQVVITDLTLEELRKYFTELGFTCVPPQSQGEPKYLIESWIE